MVEAAETGGAVDPACSLEDLLTRSEAFLSSFLRRRAQGLLLHETMEDLLQGIYAHALSVADRFEYRGEPEFRAWLGRVALQHLANRGSYWKARRRDAAQILRLDARRQGSGSTGPPLERSAAGAGPATLAILREEVLICSRAISLLLPRDQRIMGLVAADCSIDEIARDLGISQDAAQQARYRSLSRFRKVARMLGLGNRSGSR